jgi:hypothetical protein
MGWGAAALIMIAIAFIVGRPGGEQGLLSATPSATPTPPLPIVFGTGLDPATNQATGATDRFRSADPFAYSVTLPAAPGVEEILVEVVRLDGQQRMVVQEPSVQRILPEPRTFAFQVRAVDLLAAWGAGEFEMRISLPGSANLLATGRFTLLAQPEGSAG